MAKIDLASLNFTLEMTDDNFSKGIKKAEDSTDKIEKKTSKVSSFISKGFVASFAAAGTAISGAMIAGVKGADDLQGALNNLQSSTGSSAKEMEGMEEALLRIYNNNFGESFNDIADSMAMVKQVTGLTGAELEKTTQNALMMRDTFGKDVSESINTANSMMKNFGISSEEAFTLMAQGIQQGADKNGDLLDTLNEYSPQFKALGFSAEEFTDILIKGGEDGAFSIDKVGDAMKEFNIRAKDGSDTTMQAFSDLGLNAQELSQDFASGGDKANQAFQTVVTALGEVEDPLKKNQLGVSLFGTMFEDLESTAITSLGNVESKTNSTSDTLSKINEVKYNTFGEALSGIGRNLHTAIIQPMQENVLPKLNEFAQWFTNNLPSIQSTISGAMGVATGLFEGFATSIKFVIDNANILIPIITGFAGALTALTIINTVKKAMDAWKASTIVQTMAQGGLNAVLAANPIGVVVTAIGALIAIGTALALNWDTVTAKAQELWTKLSEVFGQIGTFIGEVWNGIKTTISNTVNSVNTTVSNVFNKVSNTISTIWNGIKTTISNVVNTIKTNISDKFNAVKTSVSNIFNGIKSTISSIWNSIKNTVGGAVNGIKSKVVSVFNNVKSKVSSIWNSLKNAIIRPISSAKSRVSSVVGSIRSNIISKFNNAKSRVSSIWNSIKSAITRPISQARNTVSGIINRIKDSLNFSWSIPKPKIPRISVSMRKNSWGIPYPDFDISWRKEGAIFTKPTIFNTPQGLQGVGEAGAEAVLPIEKLSSIFADTFRQVMPELSLPSGFESAMKRYKDNKTETVINNNNKNENSSSTVSFGDINVNISVEKIDDEIDMNELGRKVGDNIYNVVKNKFGTQLSLPKVR